MQRFFTFLELLLLLVFHIAQQEDEVAAFAGLQFYFQIVRGDGTPTVGNAVARSAFYYPFRVGQEPLPPPIRSRISPPVPVDAPLNGSTVVGKLCVSALREMTLLMSFTWK